MKVGFIRQVSGLLPVSGDFQAHFYPGAEPGRKEAEEERVRSGCQSEMNHNEEQAPEPTRDDGETLPEP